MSGLPKEIYVVVAESDMYIKDSKNGRTVPIAFETNALDIDSAREFRDRIRDMYGKTAIYKAIKMEEK